MRKIVVFLLLCGLFLNCATSLYQSADQALEQGSGQKALKEFIKILHQDKRKNGTYTDVRALTGAAAAYYQMGKYGKVQRMCKLILKLDPQNGGALFYGGSSLEKQEKQDWALKFYSQYKRVADNDAYRPFLEAKYYTVVTEMISRQTRAQLRRERNLSTSEIPEHSIAVLYFVDSDQTMEGEALSKGLAEMLAYDLSTIKGIKVIDRIKVQKLLEEMQLGVSAFTDPNALPRFGTLLSARTLVSGGFTIAGNEIHITTSMADVDNAKSYEADKYSGELNNIISIEKDIALGILEQLGIQVSFKQQEQLMRIPTQNYKAFLAYCYGVDMLDQGRFSSAISNFEQAFSLDPEFELARQQKQMADAMNALMNEEGISRRIFAASKNAQKMQGSFPVNQQTPPLDEGVEGRLERMSYQLDLGYLPSRESRRDAVEVGSSGVSLERKVLPTAPDPPN